ncbi:hypothetical protein [Micromonospora fluostatini]|uniref:hypothetical protein n=1 Tax=Micromonospora sp. JCM 30529 TaxID=3421643 RepID=UPI003D1844AA
MAEFDTYVKTHPTSGEQMERTPSTPAEKVSLEFDGWKRKRTGRKSFGSAASTTKSTS